MNVLMQMTRRGRSDGGEGARRDLACAVRDARVTEGFGGGCVDGIGCSVTSHSCSAAAAVDESYKQQAMIDWR